MLQGETAATMCLDASAVSQLAHEGDRVDAACDSSLLRRLAAVAASA
jgi:hypothetical protein